MAPVEAISALPQGPLSKQTPPWLHLFGPSMSTDYDKMIIDLTGDSEPEENNTRTLKTTQAPQFLSALAHRTFSSSIPLKRKSNRNSETPSSLLTSTFKNVPPPPPPPSIITTQSQHSKHNSTNHINHNEPPSLQPSSSSSFFTPRSGTPASTPQTPSETTVLSVVVPSPSVQLKQEINRAEWTSTTSGVSETELTGLSEKYYPTNAHEKRASKGAYPAAKKVPKRSDLPRFVIGQPGPLLTETRKNPVANQLYASLRRKLNAIQGPPVTVAPNDELLLAQATSDFEFINEYTLRKGVTPIAKGFLGGCSCDSVCDPARCLCLTLEINSDDFIIPYRCADDDRRLLVLSSDFINRTSMIYECNSLCGCNEKCWNRVVQRGRTVRLEIFHTGNRGFGLRSSDRIRAGQFIALYLGEVITRKIADIREEIATATKSHSYLFSLDFHINDDGIYVVDGQRLGGPTRFINHSCNPNCRMFAVSRAHADQRLYDLAFFALKDIPPNTELTFDYNPRWEKTSDVVDPSAVPCLCGEKNCRGQLWPNERKRTK